MPAYFRTEMMLAELARNGDLWALARVLKISTFAAAMLNGRVEMRWALRAMVVALVVLLAGSGAWATERDSVSEGHSEGVNPVTIIFDHISDAHEWHIFTAGDLHVTVPLPVILYSRARGSWHVFMSSRFHHGHAEYEGFSLQRDGKDGPFRVVEAGMADAPRPLDFSITKNVVGLFFASIVLVWVFVSVARRYKRNALEAPKGLQNALEPLILFVRDDIAVPSIGAKADRFMPFLLTIFFFILLNNLMGLIPIFPAGANLTGNITVTMTLALFTFLMTTLNGNKHYWKDIFNTPGMPTFLKMPIPLMPIVEVAGMFTKPVVLMIRLFANMLAGHMIALVFVCLIFLFGALNQAAAYSISPVSVFFVIFMTMLDLLVSFIQAYVFTMLSALYFGMATAGEEH